MIFSSAGSGLARTALSGGKQDYWATPLEVLGRAKGGCEDFAIAVCVTLKLLGILSEKRRMTYVKARIGGAQSIRDQAHRVLIH